MELQDFNLTRNQKAKLLASSTYQCVRCGVNYSPTRLAAKYCSKACQESISRSKYRQSEKGKEAVRRCNVNRSEAKLAWSRQRPVENAARCRYYQARKQGLTPTLTEAEREQIKDIYAEARRLSLSTGIPHDVDHIMPLSKGGLHHPQNLQVLTAHDNRSKGARLSLP